MSRENVIHPGGRSTRRASRALAIAGLPLLLALSLSCKLIDELKPAEDPQDPVAPTVPGAPTGVSGTPTNGGASLTWTAPADDGGSPILRYDLTAQPGNLGASTSGPTTSFTGTGLTNGVTYTFTVQAVNAIGAGPASAPSPGITPTATPAGPTVPGAPTQVVATGGDARATIQWTAPASDGGSAITGYTVVAQPSGLSVDTTAVTSLTMAGLTNGTSYTFTVRARNAVGLGPASAPSNAVTPAATVSATALSVAVGTGYSCAILSDRTLSCWGKVPSDLQVDGQWGACGSGLWCNVRPVPAPGWAQLSQLSITTDHGCALRTNGTARCWGSDYEGQLGDGTADGVAGGDVQLLGMASIETAQESNSANAEFTCAVRTDASAYCWGGNGYGQFGIGSFSEGANPVPVHVVAPVGFTMLSAGRGFTCGVTTGGAVYCWGRNDAQTLGHVSTGTCLGPACTLTPTQVPGLSGAAEIDSGESHTCARRTDGTVYCWGQNYYGQLGTGSTTASLLPVQVSGLTNVVQLALGYYFSCALRGDGTVWCWGSNDYGQLGTGGGGQQNSPTQVPGLSNITQISAGGFQFSDSAMNACARRSDGAVYCWGPNKWGQLGNGTTAYTPQPPTRVLF